MIIVLVYGFTWQDYARIKKWSESQNYATLTGAYPMQQFFVDQWNRYSIESHHGRNVTVCREA
jgi:hypothetical protein